MNDDISMNIMVMFKKSSQFFMNHNIQKKNLWSTIIYNLWRHFAIEKKLTTNKCEQIFQFLWNI